MDKNAKILVVCGGFSTEREVSLRSGQAIYQALLRKGYSQTTLFDLKRDNMHEILVQDPDIVFLGLHGKGGEDGCIQGMLELAEIPYTGPGVACSAVCMNKILTKRILSNAGIPTAPFFVWKKRSGDTLSAIKQELLRHLQVPLVLKSPCQGSSIGVFLIKKEEDIEPALEEVFKLGRLLLAERFLDGVELTLPILGNEEITELPVIEITSEREFYDYEAKYTVGLYHHIIPARIDKQTASEVLRIGKETYKLLGCCGLSRIDFIVDKELGPMVVEVNTLPGMTDTSLFPDAAKYVGISYEDLVERILINGMEVAEDARE